MVSGWKTNAEAKAEENVIWCKIQEMGNVGLSQRVKPFEEAKSLSQQTGESRLGGGRRSGSRNLQLPRHVTMSQLQTRDRPLALGHGLVCSKIVCTTHHVPASTWSTGVAQVGTQLRTPCTESW